jgi:DNA-binding transcriptional ArsR family regulator
MADRAIEIGNVLHALGDPTRRALVERLSHGPATVSELAALLNVTLTAVGQHLLILAAAGLAVSEKHGRTRLCRLQSAGFRVLDAWSQAHKPEPEEQPDRSERFFSQPDGEWLG